MISDIGSPMQLLRGEVDRFRGLAINVRDCLSAYRQLSYECRGCEVMVVRICSSSHNFYMFGVYLNPDLSDTIFDCVLTALVKG